MQDYRKPAFVIDQNLSKEDLEDVLADLVEREEVPVDVVNALLRERTYTRERLKAAMKFEVPENQLDIARSIENQYSGMKGALKENEISTIGIPALDEIKGGLTPEVMESASKLKKASLLVIPPVKCADIVDALNYRMLRNEMSCMTPNMFFDWFKENWQCKKCASDKKWRVAVAEGTQNVEDDPKIGGQNLNRLDLWKEKYKEMNLDVIDEPVIYLTLLMKNIYNSRHIDTNTQTMIRLMRDDLIATAGCDRGNRVRFEHAPIFADFAGLRMRGMVWIDTDKRRKKGDVPQKSKCRSSGLPG